MPTFVTLPAGTIASGSFLTFPMPSAGRGVVTVKRVSDGAVLPAFVPGTVSAASPVVSTTATITSISPAQAPAGAEITITGTNFGNAANLTAVRFGAGFITVSPSFVSNTSIVCIVPSTADNGGVRVDTTNNGNSNLFPFTVGPVPATGGGTDANLTFSVKMADFINDGTNVWGTTATDGTWGHGGKSDKFLLANADGGVLLRYATTAGAAGVLGLHTATALVPHPQMRYSFYVEPTGTLSIFELAQAVSTTITAILGNYYRIHRAAGALTIGTSADGVAWTTVYTYVGSVTVALYPMADVNANANFHLQFPQGVGLTA